jgi:hypothetical protein
MLDDQISLFIYLSFNLLKNQKSCSFSEAAFLNWNHLLEQIKLQTEVQTGIVVFHLHGA